MKILDESIFNVMNILLCELTWKKLIHWVSASIHLYLREKKKLALFMFIFESHWICYSVDPWVKNKIKIILFCFSAGLVLIIEIVFFLITNPTRIRFYVMTCLRVRVRLLFKVFFIGKYIKIIYFSFLKNYF
jgi:hypothetical protein